MKDKDLTSQPVINIKLGEIDVLENVKEKEADNCVLKVVFKNELIFRKYNSQLQQFLNKLLEEGENFIIEQKLEKLDQSFQIDRVHDSSNESITDKSIPFYSTTYEDVLHCPELEIEENEVKTVDKPQLMTCFNCLGDHHLKDCLEKLDRQKISANRKEMVAINTSRYHEEERKNAVKPGCPSIELRNAMGLKDYQLPRYIYNMRVIGYPPGWMQDAVHETSGLSLYNDAKDLSENISTNLLNDITQYDSEKFVSYPGFNCPVPDGFKDEWTKIGWLPIQSHQQLSEVIKSSNTINNKNLCKRKHLPSTTNCEEIKKSKDGTNDAIESNSCWSPKISSTPKNANSKLHLSICESPTSKNNTSFSLSKSPGTPVVGHGNPFLKLPPADKFAQDITEHLPFENLPDAVGKFENMRNVLSNVQKKLKQLNNES